MYIGSALQNFENQQRRRHHSWHYAKLPKGQNLKKLWKEQWRRNITGDNAL
jgi:hypothetical protein